MVYYLNAQEGKFCINVSMYILKEKKQDMSKGMYLAEFLQLQDFFTRYEETSIPRIHL